MSQIKMYQVCTCTYCNYGNFGSKDKIVQLNVHLFTTKLIDLYFIDLKIHSPFFVLILDLCQLQIY